MNYNNPVRNNSTFTIRVMCAIVFVVFSFAWLDFQADMLDLSQHVLSGGVTRYHYMCALSAPAVCVFHYPPEKTFACTHLSAFHAADVVVVGCQSDCS